MEMRTTHGYPDGQLFQRCVDWYAPAVERAGFESGMGGKLFATFQSAGLPTAGRDREHEAATVIHGLVP
jgi:hypothetical protein